jgi:hypothetical protein
VHPAQIASHHISSHRIASHRNSHSGLGLNKGNAPPLSVPFRHPISKPSTHFHSNSSTIEPWRLPVTIELPCPPSHFRQQASLTVPTHNLDWLAAKEQEAYLAGSQRTVAAHAASAPHTKCPRLAKTTDSSTSNYVCGGAAQNKQTISSRLRIIR